MCLPVCPIRDTITIVLPCLLYTSGHIPIIAGGTGFYIQALLYDINFEESEQDDVLREELEQYAQEHGAEALHDRLALVDPKSAEEIHAHNVKRVIRAIEFYEQTGMPISEHNEKERQKVSPYEFRYFVLNDERSHLYERINARVDEMLAQGLIEEVRALKARGCTKDMVSMQGLGSVSYTHLSDELIEVMASSGKICKHLHLPVQSGSIRILKKMNRRYTKESYLELTEKIKKAVPDISLTTDIIVGFPGETEEDFQETLDVVRKVRYDSAFTFIYSKRTGKPAAAMEDQIPADVVKDRFDRLLSEVQSIASEVCAVHEGKDTDVYKRQEHSRSSATTTVPEVPNV